MLIILALCAIAATKKIAFENSFFKKVILKHKNQCPLEVHVIYLPVNKAGEKTLKLSSIYIALSKK